MGGLAALVAPLTVEDVVGGRKQLPAELLEPGSPAGSQLPMNDQGHKMTHREREVHQVQRVALGGQAQGCPTDESVVDHLSQPPPPITCPKSLEIGRGGCFSVAGEFEGSIEPARLKELCQGGLSARRTSSIGIFGVIPSRRDRDAPSPSSTQAGAILSGCWAAIWQRLDLGWREVAWTVRSSQFGEMSFDCERQLFCGKPR